MLFSFNAARNRQLDSSGKIVALLHDGKSLQEIVVDFGKRRLARTADGIINVEGGPIKVEAARSGIEVTVIVANVGSKPLDSRDASPNRKNLIVGLTGRFGWHESQNEQRRVEMEAWARHLRPKKTARAGRAAPVPYGARAIVAPTHDYDKTEFTREV
jgi:hypothetical protein